MGAPANRLGSRLFAPQSAQGTLKDRGREWDGLDERGRALQKAFEVPMLVAALLVVPVLIVEAGTYPATVATTAEVANWAIWIAFAAETAAMSWIAVDRRRWIVRHPVNLAIVFLTPPFIPAVGALRLLRLLRLLALVRAVGAGRSIFSADGVRYVGLVSVSVIVLGGVAFAEVEGMTSWDGIWWAAATATTVGYGDISPATDAGRVVALAVMATSIGFLAVLTGAIAERFISKAPGVGASSSAIADLERLADLRDRGVLTDEEFAAKKAEILSATQ